MLIRPATSADAAAIQRIYAPIVEETAISFELEAPDADEIARRIERASDLHPWIVAEGGAGELLGYAYATTFRGRAAYDASVESTVYVAPEARRRGVARALMEDLLERLRTAGAHLCVAGVALPNDASVALHEALGFRPVGTFQEAGAKFGRWHDIHFLAIRLGDGPPGLTAG